MQLPVSTILILLPILGPTCDNLDILPAPFYLPVDAEEGDWIEIGQTGAYSNSAATRFNGFSRKPSSR